MKSKDLQSEYLIKLLELQIYISAFFVHQYQLCCIHYHETLNFCNTNALGNHLKYRKWGIF